MKLTNREIYKYAQSLSSAFEDKGQRLPAKLNFSIHKNTKILFELAKEIEIARINIAQTHGELQQETQEYLIKPENIHLVQQELSDLFDIEQEVNICMIKADSFNNDYTLTRAQIEAIMFMIEEA